MQIVPWNFSTSCTVPPLFSPNASSATIKPQKSFEVRLRVLRFGVILFNSRAVDRYSSRTAQRMILRRVRT